ncbi:hypothetical protein ACLOJK_029652, partial [Asimina triloba]
MTSWVKSALCMEFETLVGMEELLSVNFVSAFRSTNFVAKSSVNAHVNVNVNVKNVKATMARVLGIEYFGPLH